MRSVAGPPQTVSSVLEVDGTVYASFLAPAAPAAVGVDHYSSAGAAGEKWGEGQGLAGGTFERHLLGSSAPVARLRLLRRARQLEQEALLRRRWAGGSGEGHRRWIGDRGAAHPLSTSGVLHGGVRGGTQGLSSHEVLRVWDVASGCAMRSVSAGCLCLSICMCVRITCICLCMWRPAYVLYACTCCSADPPPARPCPVAAAAVCR